MLTRADRPSKRRGSFLTADLDDEEPQSITIAAGTVSILDCRAIFCSNYRKSAELDAVDRNRQHG